MKIVMRNPSFSNNAICIAMPAKQWRYRKRTVFLAFTHFSALLHNLKHDINDGCYNTLLIRTSHNDDWYIQFTQKTTEKTMLIRVRLEGLRVSSFSFTLFLLCRNCFFLVRFHVVLPWKERKKKQRSTGVNLVVLDGLKKKGSDLI